MIWKSRSNDQSMNMALTTNRKLTKEIHSSNKVNSDAESKDFTRAGTQTIKSTITSFTLIYSANNFDLQI